ncbi:MAG: hypothetical protein JWM14_1386 [Chitinophagaceae bacterium]|nr:hypothetical protein [Chitinophagaceae bacterium]
MKNSITLVFVIMTVIVTASCTKVIDMNLKDVPVKTVIQAEILTDSFALVRVTKTAPYLENSPTPIITNAFIVISDDLGAKDTLDHIGDGYYKGDIIVGNTARVYNLSVDADGKVYTATTTIPTGVSFVITGRNYVSATEANRFHKEGYYPTIKTTLPPGDSYYLFKYYKNDSLYVPEGAEDDIFISDSKFIGTEIDGYETPYEYQLGDVARIDIYRITKEGYNFYNELSAQLNNDGGFFSTPPANTSTNFSNGAVGVFLGASRETESLTIVP